MSPQIGSVTGNCHIMTESDRYLTAASRTRVGLGRLVGLNPADLDWAVQSIPDSRARLWHGQPKKAQATSAKAAITAATTKT